MTNNIGLTCTNHQLDVLREVPSPVYPHDSNHLPESHPEDSEACSVRVHQVEDVLAVGGDAGEAEQETHQTPGGRHLHLVIPQRGKSVIESRKNCLQCGKLGVDPEEEQHEEEEYGPYPGQGEASQSLGVGHEGQTLPALGDVLHGHTHLAGQVAEDREDHHAGEDR